MLVFGTSPSEKRLYPIPCSVHKRLMGNRSQRLTKIPHGSDHILWNTQYFQFHFMLRRSLHVRPLTRVYNKICGRGRKYTRNFHASLQLAVENPNLDQNTSDPPGTTRRAARCHRRFPCWPPCSVFPHATTTVSQALAIHRSLISPWEPVITTPSLPAMMRMT
ncbi:hypothetical protein M404DRAFT_389791 [Pisolithus tinctorius Marx 270]|uniref:Uncharacterized protein n=1 Tax=Pisolithus tinctorius Marx 270 TaxID=870435 RepID=A0A0C3P3I5_PISTI|nr:hypothetical protein M404DRAFT_389791 [Pisolithus tinctorius Marx 270]